MRTRPRTKFVKQQKTRRCSKCGAHLSRYLSRCRRCSASAARPKK